MFFQRKNWVSSAVQTKTKTDGLYNLITAYRWLTMLPPTIALIVLNSPNKQVTLGLYGLAWLNTFFQTLIQFSSRHTPSNVVSSTNSVDSSSQSWVKPLPILVTLELLICAFLNGAGGIWASPYYLYSLVPIFQCAFLFGVAGAVTAALTLSFSYITALLASIVLTGQGGNWLVSVTNLTGFAGSAALFGYQSAISAKLRQYAVTIAQYRNNLELQNQALVQSNQQLEQLRVFSQVLSEGKTPAQLEQLALTHLGNIFRLGLGVIPTVSSNPTNAAKANGSVQIVKAESAIATWLQVARDSSLPGIGSDAEMPDSVISVVKAGQTYWVVPLLCKGSDYGLLVVNAEAAPGRFYSELNAKPLLALLADQLARALNNLEQSQTLAITTERSRLAMDMHDVIAQSLFGLAFNLDACLKLYEHETMATKARLSDLREVAFDTLASVRAVIYDLWNEEAEELDFATLVKAYIRKVGKLYPFKVSFEEESQLHQLNIGVALEGEVQKALYRLVQEALSNAAKHSGAKRVTVRLCCNAKQLQIEVIDDGVGFTINDEWVFKKLPTAIHSTNTANKNQSTTTTGLGLYGMRERITQLGGSLSVENVAGGGAKLTATLPNREALA